MMNNRITVHLASLQFALIAVVQSFTFSSAASQPSSSPAVGCIGSLQLPEPYSYRYADATQLWRLTDNAAGLALDSAQNRGIAYFDIQHSEGDYHRVQEGGQRNQLEFFTERYQQIGSLLVGYGSFRFDMGRTKDRAWCDVMRPYNANPFYSGSCQPGKYDTQQFDLTAAVGTSQLWGLTAGLRLDYKVGDLSRLRDPRSRSQLLDYQLTPSFTYTSEPHTLGISGHYHRRKEKIPNMTTVQQDPNLKYYLMSGMEQAVGITGGYSGFSREWVDHRFGIAVSYGFNNGTVNSLATASIERGSEDVLGQYKYEPGHYVSYRYGLNARNRLHMAKGLHQIDFNVSYEQAYADEYRQMLLQERDAEHGYTSYRYETLINFRKRYQLQLLNTQLHYRYSVSRGPALTKYVGLKAALNATETEHLLPQSSLALTHADFTLEGSHDLLSSRLYVDAEVTYHLSAKAELLLADATTDMAQQVWLPDMMYYDANYWRGHAALTYQFPLKVKGVRNTWFLRAYADYLITNNSLYSATFGASFGIFY